MSKIEPEVQTDKSKRGGWRGRLLEEGEGISPGTYMNNPWTWTTVRGLIVKVGGWAWQRKLKGGKWGKCNSIKNKK